MSSCCADICLTKSQSTEGLICTTLQTQSCILPWKIGQIKTKRERDVLQICWCAVCRQTSSCLVCLLPQSWKLFSKPSVWDFFSQVCFHLDIWFIIFTLDQQWLGQYCGTDAFDFGCDSGVSSVTSTQKMTFSSSDPDKVQPCSLSYLACGMGKWTLKRHCFCIIR